MSKHFLLLYSLIVQEPLARDLKKTFLKIQVHCDDEINHKHLLFDSFWNLQWDLENGPSSERAVLALSKYAMCLFDTF